MPTELELWDGSFHPILLHGSLEHLASNSKNIRESLNHVAKYISNKQIDPKKSNDVEDLKDVGKAVWNLISFVYQSSWNLLYTDNNSATLRQKVALKFTSKVRSCCQQQQWQQVQISPSEYQKTPSPYPSEITQGG